MSTWLHPKAFGISAGLMLVVQLAKLPSTGIDAEWLGRAAAGVIVGGVFWGAIATFVYNRFYKRPR